MDKNVIVYHRGWEIYWNTEDQQWRFCDTDEWIDDKQVDRPCKHCDKNVTVKGYDPCLGELPGVINACCGHGVPENSYIMFENNFIVRGFIVQEIK